MFCVRGGGRGGWGQQRKLPLECQPDNAPGWSLCGPAAGWPGLPIFSLQSQWISDEAVRVGFSQNFFFTCLCPQLSSTYSVGPATRGTYGFLLKIVPLDDILAKIECPAEWGGKGCVQPGGHGGGGWKESGGGRCFICLDWNVLDLNISI